MLCLLFVVSFILTAFASSELTLSKTADPTTVTLAGYDLKSFTQVCLGIEGFGKVSDSPPSPIPKCEKPLHSIFLVEESKAIQFLDPHKERYGAIKRSSIKCVMIVTG
ncbi:hypothetical protein GEMRC1_004291 [Eukaryota sp. GEM-RC1]